MSIPKFLTEEMAKATAGNSEPFVLDGKTYYLTQDPYLDQNCYTANAVRVGDNIEDGEVDTHDLRWDLLTPKELGYRVCDSTAIPAHTEKGCLTLDELSEKYGIITVFDDGQYIPIESPETEEEITSCMAMRFGDDLDDDGDIRIYNVSWFESKDKINPLEIRHGDEERQVVSYNGHRFLLNDCDVMSYKPFRDDEWYVEEEDACDWDKPSAVSEKVGYEEVKYPVKEQKTGHCR